MTQTLTPMKRQLLLNRWGQLKQERATWWSHWQELSTYLTPWSGRFFRQDRNRGTRRNNQIYDNTAARALKTLGAGLMAGASSSARPWFRLATPDPDLNKAQGVKVWLNDVTQRMQAVFQKSNTYDALRKMYEELGAFGTSASIVLGDYQNVIHNYPQTMGEYAIDTDMKGRVNTIYREFEKNVHQIVQEFGLENCSPTVRSAYARGELGTWIPILHAIEPRSDRDPRKLDALNMEWSSYYIELGTEQGHVLRESGFKKFPALAPRWDVSGGDIYGNSPGMECLGDIKALQHEQKRKAQGIDYKTNPPLQLPDSMKNREVEVMPGGFTYVPAGGGQKVESLWDVNIELGELREDIAEVAERINKSFFYDVFVMLENLEKGQMTATEVAERRDEKMLMMGPVLLRVNTEVLYPLIDNTFAHMVERGVIPPPPQELVGMDLDVEFVSVLAQAQRAIGVNGVDRFVANLGVVAKMKPEVLDKFDSDSWADIYGDDLGVDPRLIIANDKVAIVRQARNQAEAAQQQAATAEQASGAARNLAQAAAQPSQSGSDILNLFSGYQSPAGTELRQ